MSAPFSHLFYFEENQNIDGGVSRLEFIDHNVAAGSHYVECELAGEEDDRNVAPFKVIGIFSS